MTNKNHKSILVTGCTGFIGEALVSHLLTTKHQFRGLARKNVINKNYKIFKISEVCDLSSSEKAFEGIHTVVHLIGRAHQFDDNAETENEYFRINVKGTIEVAKKALKNGVKHIIFISSIKATGEKTLGNESFNQKSICLPQDAYGKSKLKAEKELIKICAGSQLSYTIFRPPLVYGPGVKGNFASLIKLVKKFPILPFAALTNKRSFISITNLCSAILTAIESENVNNKIFFVSDNSPISTSELIRNIALVFNPNLKLLKIPQIFWDIAKKTPIISKRIEKLTDSLVVDPTDFMKSTGWIPTVSMLSELKRIKL